MTSTADRQAPSRLPLRRPTQDRWVAGVCAGVAAHTGVKVGYVRAAIAVLALAGGAGVLLYVFWWLTVPSGDPRAAAEAQRPAALGRIAPRLRVGSTTVTARDVVLGLVLLALAGLLVALRVGVDVEVGWLVPVLIVLGGAALAWSRLDDVERGSWFAGRGRAAAADNGVLPVDGRARSGRFRLLGGLGLVLVGLLLLVTQADSFAAMARSTVSAVAVLAGVAVVLAPWWLRLVRQLGDERAARARSPSGPTSLPTSTTPCSRPWR
ncbi:hypothetical protein GCM10025865_03960 [Paraoerskovia sediminicola]|uniref:Phage shock protein PspC N-terminal domain-containing protein n=1 Tax=Paraoerskovia sediminicola TaxID=1138587 RepID=A0ABN6X8T9_9CELL|nr:hypothetical protein GCM10025865_03960 [Paraoerskovia sediminicola]